MVCFRTGHKLAKWLMAYDVRQSRVARKKIASAETTVDIARDLERITYHGSCEPILPTLQALHEAHQLAVPFENLDISLGRAIVLDKASLWTKIVEHHRGGFCYELNGLFALQMPCPWVSGRSALSCCRPRDGWIWTGLRPSHAAGAS